MPYATAAQLIARIDDDQLAQLAAPGVDSDVDGVLLRLTIEGGDRSAYSQAQTDAADAALVAINSALADASLEINSYISPRYTLPLTQAVIDASPLPNACSDITIYQMAADRVTDLITEKYEKVIKWLRDVSKNIASLGEEDTGVATPQGRVVTADGESSTDWGTY